MSEYRGMSSQVMKTIMHHWLHHYELLLFILPEADVFKMISHWAVTAGEELESSIHERGSQLSLDWACEREQIIKTVNVGSHRRTERSDLAAGKTSQKGSLLGLCPPHINTPRLRTNTAGIYTHAEKSLSEFLPFQTFCLFCPAPFSHWYKNGWITAPLHHFQINAWFQINYFC